MCLEEGIIISRAPWWIARGTNVKVLGKEKKLEVSNIVVREVKLQRGINQTKNNNKKKEQNNKSKRGEGENNKKEAARKLVTQGLNWFNMASAISAWQQHQCCTSCCMHPTRSSFHLLQRPIWPTRTSSPCGPPLHLSHTLSVFSFLILVFFLLNWFKFAVPI